MTLLRSSERNNTFFTGVPLRSTPACIVSSLWVYFRTAVLCRGSATLHPCLYYNVPTGLAFVLFHKTFCPTSQDILGFASG